MKTLLCVLTLVGCGAPDPFNCAVWGQQCHVPAGRRGQQGDAGESGVHGRDGAAGQGCTVSETGMVDCGSSSFQIPTPKDGAIGPRGVAGENGATGRDGVDGIAGVAGRDGRDGRDGAVGPAGEIGAEGLQGPAGAAGRDGTDAVIEVIDPCGDAPGRFDEVLLRLSDSRLFAHYADGTKQFLTEVVAGSYQTTDGTGCTFTVSSEGVVTW